MIFFKSRDFQTAQERGQRGGISYGASTFFLPDRCLMVSNPPHGGVQAPPNLPQTATWSAPGGHSIAHETPTEM